MRASDFEAKFEAGAALTQDIDLGRARRVNEGRPQVLCYIVAGSGDPDRIECAVPYRIDDREIFFGPCKKALREWMRNRYARGMWTDTRSSVTERTARRTGEPAATCPCRETARAT